MKKLKALIAVLLVGVMALGLVACGGKTLEGTYSKKVLVGKESFSFDGDEFVMQSSIGLKLSGTYEIDDDKIILTFEDVDKIAKLFGSAAKEDEGKVELSFAENEDGSITIDGAKYEKE